MTEQENKLRNEAARAMNGFASELFDALIQEYGEKAALKLIGWLMRKRSQSALPMAMFPDSQAVMLWALKIIREHKAEVLQLLNALFDEGMDHIESVILKREPA